MSEPNQSDDRLLASVRSRLDSERGWRGRLRALPTPWRVGLGIAVLVALALAIGVFAPRSDLADYPVGLLSAAVIALAGGAILSTLLLLRPLQLRPVSARRVALLAFAGFGIPAVLAWPQAHDLVHAHPESFLGTGDDFAKHALGCFAFGLVTALPFVALLLALDRRERRPWRDVALCAAAGGLAGNLTLLLHCPLVAREHLYAGHATVGLGFLALLVALAARRRSS